MTTTTVVQCSHCLPQAESKAVERLTPQEQMARKIAMEQYVVNQLRVSIYVFDVLP